MPATKRRLRNKGRAQRPKKARRSPSPALPPTPSRPPSQSPSGNSESDGGIDTSHRSGHLQAFEQKVMEFGKIQQNTYQKMWSLYRVTVSDVVSIVDPHDYDRPEPASAHVYHSAGVPIYILRDSVYLRRLAENPEVLSQHQKLDTPKRGFFPVKIPAPRIADLGEAWEGIDGDVTVVGHYEDSAERIESLIQGLTTGPAVKEFRAMLKHCGLVPGHPTPTYSLDVLSTDPYRAEAGSIRRQQEMLLGGSDDVLTPFIDNDRDLAEVRSAVGALNTTLDRIAPNFRQGLLRSLATTGELFESSGRLSPGLLVNDLGVCHWAENPLKAVSQWTVRKTLKSQLGIGGSGPSMEENVYSNHLVRFDNPVFLSGELIDVPGGIKQKIWKGCLAIPLRLPVLRVLADDHGFDGSFVTPESSTWMFALSYYLQTSKEPGFVDHDAKDQNGNDVPLTATRMNYDDILLLKRTATPIQATRLGPLLEAAMGIAQTHRKSILDRALSRIFREDPLGKNETKSVIYTADDPKDYPRTGGAQQHEGLDSGPFHRFILLARDLVYPDCYWNVETSPRRDETVAPRRNSILLEMQHGLADLVECVLRRALMLQYGWTFSHVCDLIPDTIFNDCVGNVIRHVRSQRKSLIPLPSYDGSSAGGDGGPDGAESSRGDEDLSSSSSSSSDGGNSAPSTDHGASEAGNSSQFSNLSPVFNLRELNIRLTRCDAPERIQLRELVENGSVYVEAEMRDEDSDDGTEERRLVIVEDENDSGGEQTDKDQLDNSQPLHLPVRGHDIAQSGEGSQDTSAGTLSQDHVVVAHRGPSTSRGDVSAVEAPQLVQVVRRLASGGSRTKYVSAVSLAREDKFAKVREGSRKIEAFLADLGGNNGT